MSATAFVLLSASISAAASVAAATTAHVAVSATAAAGAAEVHRSSVALRDRWKAEVEAVRKAEAAERQRQLDKLGEAHRSRFRPKGAERPRVPGPDDRAAKRARLDVEPVVADSALTVSGRPFIKPSPFDRVPHAVRQKALDSITERCLELVHDVRHERWALEWAYSTALKSEKEIHGKSQKKQAYTGRIIAALRKLRTGNQAPVRKEGAKAAKQKRLKEHESELLLLHGHIKKT